MVEMVVDRGMGGGKFLQGLYIPELRHRALSSPEWLMRIFGSIVEPAPTFLIGGVADYRHRRSVGPEPIRHDHLGRTIAFHRTPQKLQRSLAIPPFRGKNFQHFPFVINSPPQIMHLPVDTDKHLVQVPAPVRIRMASNPGLPDLGGKHRTKPVPLEPHRFMAEVDAALEQQILDLPQRQRIADVHHNRQADYLG